MKLTLKEKKLVKEYAKKLVGKKKLIYIDSDREIKENKNMKTKKNLKESFSNELENLKDQFEKLKYYTKINSDGSISAYYNKFNPDRLTISVSDHPDHPAGRFYLDIFSKVEVNSRSLADPTAAYQTTSARIVKHSTKKIRKYYDDFAKVIASINKVLSANNFTLLNYSDIKESKQFKMADVVKKILKERRISTELYDAMMASTNVSKLESIMKIYENVFENLLSDGYSGTEIHSFLITHLENELAKI